MSSRPTLFEPLDQRILLTANGGETEIRAAAVETGRMATISTDLPTRQRVGTTITVTMNGGEADDAYRFSVAKAGEPQELIYDFKRSGVFEWTPTEEGLYTIAVVVLSEADQDVYTVTRRFRILPIARNQPVVSGTDNPLVALYSAPDLSNQGESMRVAFFSPENPELTLSLTDAREMEPGATNNFYLGGMRADSTYVVRHQILDDQGNHVRFGPWKLFNTGSLPSNFPTSTVSTGTASGPVPEQKFILSSAIAGNVPLGIQPFPFATDVEGEIVWYNEIVDSEIWRTIDGGELYQLEQFDSNRYQELRKIDLAGNVVLETNIERINAQLESLGEDTGTQIHHEARPLPNGHTAILVNVEKMLSDVQGPGPVNILGDMIVVLDEDFQVAWAWNGFDHLDVTRSALLGETCAGLTQPGCPPVLETPVANDWMHSNAITYDPSDGSLLISIRHQDWVVKVDYSDGSGDGDVVWRLGPDGDFTIDSDDEFPWFSHQHDPNFDAAGRLAIYDNANTRCTVITTTCNSRGQVYSLDEANMTATLDINADLGDFAFAVGSAQPLSNGNYHFNSGILPPGPPQAPSRADEVASDGSIVYALTANISAYRSHRMASLYALEPEMTDAVFAQAAPEVDWRYLANKVKKDDTEWFRRRHIVRNYGLALKSLIY